MGSWPRKTFLFLFTMGPCNLDPLNIYFNTLEEDDYVDRSETCCLIQKKSGL